MAYGKPKDILTTALLKKVFNVETTIINNPITHNPLVIYGRG